MSSAIETCQLNTTVGSGFLRLAPKLSNNNLNRSAETYKEPTIDAEICEIDNNR